MSFESRYWKKFLKKDIDYINRKLKINLDEIEYDEDEDEEDEFEEIFSMIEIKIFIIAYSLRKLIDSKKISNEISNVKLEVCLYPKKGKGLVTFINSHKWDKHYNFDKKKRKRMYIREISNQIIHSYIFDLVRYGKRICYIYFVSDRNRNKYLLRIKIKDFLEIVRRFSKDFVVYTHSIYDEEKKDYKIVNSNKIPKNNL